MAKSLDMTRGNPYALLIRFALPLLAGNLFQQLYNTVDCFIVGNYLGKEALAAIGSTSQLVFTVIGFFMGLSTGASVVISQCFGAHDEERLRRVVHTTLLATLLLGTVLSAAGFFVSPLMLKLISVPADVFDKASEYLRIFFGGLIFLLIYNMGAGILRAVGDSKRPLIFLIASSVVNVVLDVVCIIGLGWGIAGAAYATVVAEAVAMALVLFVLVRTDEPYRVRVRELRIDRAITQKIIALGLPGAVSSALTAFSNTFMQKYINVFGSACIAGWASFAKFDQFAIMPMVSISHSATTFVGQNYGAKNMARVKQGMKSALVIGWLCMLVIPLLLFVCAEPLVSLFSRDADVIRYGAGFIRMTAPFYVLCCTTMLFSQTMRGLDSATIPTLITFSTFVLMRQLYLFVVTRFTTSFLPVAFAYPFSWFPSTVLSVLYYRWYTKKFLKNA